MGKKKNWKNMSITERRSKTDKMGERLGIDKGDFKDYNHSRSDRGLMHNQGKYEEAVRKGMMNDYDTRRGLEAAAMSGDKKAGKIAAKGFSNLRQASKGYDYLAKLKKEHVGGGGFHGAKNKAGLTQALVELDREKQDEGYKREFASIKDMNALRDDLEAQEEASNYQKPEIEKSDALARAEDRVNEADGGAGSIYGSNNAPAATDNPPADASKHFLYDYRDKVKEKYGPLTNTEREISNAAKRVQDSYGR